MKQLLTPPSSPDSSLPPEDPKLRYGIIKVRDKIMPKYWKTLDLSAIPPKYHHLIPLQNTLAEKQAGLRDLQEGLTEAERVLAERERQEDIRCIDEEIAQQKGELGELEETYTKNRAAVRQAESALWSKGGEQMRLRSGYVHDPRAPEREKLQELRRAGGDLNGYQRDRKVHLDRLQTQRSQFLEEITRQIELYEGAVADMEAQVIEANNALLRAV